jgi:hypothetical protein
VLLVLTGVAMIRLMYRANRVVQLLPGILRDDRPSTARNHSA